MKILNIQTNQTAFKSQNKRGNIHQPRTDYNTETYYQGYDGNFYPKGTVRKPRTDYNTETYYQGYDENFYPKDNSDLRRRLAAIFAATVLAGSGIGGYVLGRNKGNDEAYINAYDRGWRDAYIQMEKNQQTEDIPSPTQTNQAVINPTAFPLQEKVIEPIPDKVNALANGSVTEYDLDKKPYLYRENMSVPEYFADYNIDANTLKTAQRNMARVFISGDYIIISPREAVTMGELKKVFGILDSVIGLDPLNELATRPQIQSSSNNWDNAIVEAGDAIRIKDYDKEKGHQVGVYTAHKSNNSRKKIAQEIIEWANKTN